MLVLIPCNSASIGKSCEATMKALHDTIKQIMPKKLKLVLLHDNTLSASQREFRLLCDTAVS
jgi:hypothetical protein